MDYLYDVAWWVLYGFVALYVCILLKLHYLNFKLSRLHKQTIALRSEQAALLLRLSELSSNTDELEQASDQRPGSLSSSG